MRQCFYAIRCRDYRSGLVWDIVAQRNYAADHQQGICAGEWIGVNGNARGFDSDVVWYVAQGVTINAECDSDLAFIAQVICVRNVVNGDVDVAFGQTFVLEDGAKIEGDLRVRFARIITIASGAEITGNIEVEGAPLVVVEDGATLGGK